MEREKSGVKSSTVRRNGIAKLISIIGFPFFLIGLIAFLFGIIGLFSGEFGITNRTTGLTVIGSGLGALAIGSLLFGVSEMIDILWEIKNANERQSN